MSRPEYFQLYANCIPVQGASRSTVCDLQRQRYVLIPNGLYAILTEHDRSTLDEIKTAYGHEHDDVIDEYFAFLAEEDLGFWCDEPDAFPEMSLDWDRPERITNALIDIDDGSTYDVASIFRQLDDLFCKSVQLRYYDPVDQATLTETLKPISEGRLRSVELLLPASNWALPSVDALTKRFPRISRVFLYGADESRDLTLSPQDTFLIWNETEVTSADCCGKIHPEYFVSHVDIFTEAQNHNTCLNRKVSIDVDGEIRNCPAMPISYGNVADTSLHSVVTRRDFQSLWEINKDQIEVCRDCEFRYVCTDCRAFITDPDDRYSKPSKCAYDPYTATWGDGSSTPEGASRIAPDAVASGDGGLEEDDPAEAVPHEPVEDAC